MKYLLIILVSCSLFSQDYKIKTISFKNNSSEIVWKRPTDKDFYAPGWKEFNKETGQWTNNPKLGQLDDLSSLRTVYDSVDKNYYIKVTLEDTERLPKEIYAYTMLNTAGKNLVNIYKKILSSKDKEQNVKEFIDAVGTFKYDPYRLREVKPKDPTKKDFRYGVNVFANPKYHNPNFKGKIDLLPPSFNEKIYKQIKLTRKKGTNEYICKISPKYAQEGSMIFGYKEKGTFRPIPLYYDNSYGEFINALRYNFTPKETTNLNTVWGVNLYTDMAETVKDPSEADLFPMLNTDKIEKIQEGDLVEFNDLYEKIPLPVKSREGDLSYIKHIKLGETKAFAWLDNLRQKYPEADIIYFLPVEENSNQGSVPNIKTGRVFQLKVSGGGTKKALAYNISLYPDGKGGKAKNIYKGFRYQYDNSSNAVDPILGTEEEFVEFIKYAKKLFGRVMLDAHLTKVALTGYEIKARPEMAKVYDEILKQAGFKRLKNNNQNSLYYLNTMLDDLIILDKNGNEVIENGKVKTVPSYFFFHPVNINANEPLDPITRPKILGDISAIPIEYRGSADGKWGFTEFNVANKYVLAIRTLLLYDYYAPMNVDLRSDAYQNIPLLYRIKMGVLTAMMKEHAYRKGSNFILMGETVVEDPLKRGFSGIDVAQTLSALQVIVEEKNYQKQDPFKARYLWYRKHVIGDKGLSVTVGLGHHDTSQPFETFGLATDAMGRHTLTLGRNGKEANWIDFVSWQTFLALEANTMIMEPLYMRTGARQTNNPKGEILGKDRGKGYYMLNNDENVNHEHKKYNKLFDRIIKVKKYLVNKQYSINTKMIPLKFKSGPDDHLLGVLYLDKTKETITVLLKNVADISYNISFDWKDVIPAENFEEFNSILKSNNAKNNKFLEIFNVNSKLKFYDGKYTFVDKVNTSDHFSLNVGKNSEIQEYETLIFTSLAESELNTINDIILTTIPELKFKELKQSNEWEIYKKTAKNTPLKKLENLLKNLYKNNKDFLINFKTALKEINLIGCF